MLRIYFLITVIIILLASFSQHIVKLNGIANDDPKIKVTLLGTGTPQPVMERFGASILVEAGGKTLLFDAGRGCLQRLRQLNVGYDSLDGLFFTHLHSDHIVGLPDLWLVGWVTTARKNPLKVFGPEGTKDMTDNLRKAYAFDIKIRMEDDKGPEEGSKLLTTDIKEGVVYESGGVKVIAFLVDHYPVVPAFGYRIEYSGRSVTLSGDTKYSENLIAFAKGTDLLVHEVVIAPDTITRANRRYSAVSHHTNPEQAGKVFQFVKPKLAVYSHIVRLYSQTNEELLRRTKLNYAGALMIGEDLMSFSIGDTVAVNERKEK